MEEVTNRYVQVRDPKTKHYTLIDRDRGRIVDVSITPFDNVVIMSDLIPENKG